MQIKRFEAADMTEALRMVKREFGSDAVILSAKEVRSRRFFSALRKKSVEITAAMDYPKNDVVGPSEFSGLLAEQVDTEANADHVSLSVLSKTATPTFRDATEPPHPLISSNSKGAQAEKLDRSLEQRTITQRLTPIVAGGISSDASEGAANPGSPDKASFHFIEKQNVIAKPFYRQMEDRKVIALVGPSGVGKTTALAKLARHCVVEEKKRVGLVSIDRFCLGANTLLQRIAGILNLPVMIIHDGTQFTSALDELKSVDVVLVDTPGVDHTEDPIFSEVGRMLGQADLDEIHLVVNVAFKDEVFSNVIETFAPLGVDRLLFTHIDKCEPSVAILNVLFRSGLFTSFYSDGVDLFNHLHETSASRLSSIIKAHESSVKHRVTVFPKSGQMQPGSMSDVESDASGPMSYLANRNSELFHHPDCKSVKRINVENLTAFNTIEQAMDKGFKPCRACCDINMIRKATALYFGHQRASAL